mmetsp:Transcript_66550/g.124158  ORF Transcript_66550/g.124158 Transcript_66550/m.124158 type:complete len:427 (-) Transcript_66550:134-1414(-)
MRRSRAAVSNRISVDELRSRGVCEDFLAPAISIDADPGCPIRDSTHEEDSEDGVSFVCAEERSEDELEEGVGSWRKLEADSYAKGRATKWTETEMNAVYGAGYRLLVKMGYDGNGEAPLTGVKRHQRVGLQDDEHHALDHVAMKALTKRPAIIDIKRDAEYARAAKKRQLEFRAVGLYDVLETTASSGDSDSDRGAVLEDPAEEVETDDEEQEEIGEEEEEEERGDEKSSEEDVTGENPTREAQLLAESQEESFDSSTARFVCHGCGDCFQFRASLRKHIVIHLTNRTTQDPTDLSAPLDVEHHDRPALARLAAQRGYESWSCPICAWHCDGTDITAVLDHAKKAPAKRLEHDRLLLLAAELILQSPPKVTSRGLVLSGWGGLLHRFIHTVATEPRRGAYANTPSQDDFIGLACEYLGPVEDDIFS